MSSRSMVLAGGSQTVPPSVVGTSSVASASSSTSWTLSISKPAGTQSGDLMLMYVGSSTFGLFDTPVGWTLRGATSYLAVFSRVDASDSAYTVTGTPDGGSGSMVATIVAVTAGTLDTVGSIGTSISPMTAPSINVANSGSYLLAFFQGNVGTSAPSAPAGMTSVSSRSSAPRNRVAGFVVAAGATGDKTSDNANPASAVLIAVAPTS